MKKTLAALMSLCVFASLLSGCGGETAGAAQTASADPAGGSWELVYGRYDPQQVALELALSLPKFEGKSREEWYSYAESIGKADNEALVWAEGASLSPDGNTVVYHSNKDCIDAGGMSVFAFDLNTGEERILLKSENGAYDGVFAWLDDRTLLCFCTPDQGKTRYLVCGLDGGATPVSFQGEAPNIYAVRGRYLAYESDLFHPQTIYFGHFDAENQWVETNSLEITDGRPINCGAISPDGTLLAFPLRNPDPDNPARTMNLWDISSGALTPIPDPAITDMADPVASAPKQDDQGKFLEVEYTGTGADGNVMRQLWRYVLPEES